MKKFKRAGHGKERPDATGRVVIKIYLQDLKKEKGGFYTVKGNMTKTISIEDVKVSEVYSAIEKVLF